MDFDEYEYLEKTVENLDSANGRSAERSEKDRSRSSKHRDDDHHRSKRAKLEGEVDGHRERESSRLGENDRHRRDREYKEDKNGKGSDRDRKRDRDKESDRAVDRERDPHRRSSSRSERRGDDERNRHMERNREREPLRDIRDRDHRDSRRREKKDDATELEVDPERDQRTVFAYQICLKADERDVYEFFSRAGKVRDVRLIMDRNSRRSKGVGYIEFYDAMSVPMAIALSGQLLLGQPVMVKPSEAEKNLVQSTVTSAGAGGLSGPYSGGARKLYVGNLHFNMTEDQLRQVFEPFGAVELVQLPLDLETGHCKGFGFVQFVRLEDAKAAQSLNGQLEIAGRTIKVSAMTDQTGMQDVGANANDLDDDDGGGLSLNARSRALLMQKLDRSGTTTNAGALATPVSTSLLPVPTASVLGAPPLNPLLPSTMPTLAGIPSPALAFASTTTQSVDNIGVPSECLLLKNMFDPNVESESDFDLDIKEDVQEECSKFGTVKHIYVEKNSQGLVYLRFGNAAEAMNAQRALHGRWFAGKMITASFMIPQNYDAKFPK